MNQLFCIGNYSSKGVFCLNFHAGKFEPFCSFSNLSKCSYLIKNNNFLYLVSEINTGIVASYQIENSSFSPLGYASTYGKSPCHLMIDTNRNIIYISNYEDGSFTAFQIDANGKIGSRLYFEKFQKNISHIHYITLSQDKEHLFVIDLGTNKIYAYTICTNPIFDLHLCSTFSFPQYSQPRHLVLDSKNRIHVITESSCEIYTLSFENNVFSFLFKTSLFSSFLTKEDNDTGCSIKINKNCSFVYASLRGQNLICVFEILENQLNLIQTISCFGSTPRDISFDKTGNYLICANQGSNNLTVFSICPKNGRLFFESTYPIEKPSCILPL